MSTICHVFVTGFARRRLPKSLREAFAVATLATLFCTIGPGLLTPVSLAQTPAANPIPAPDSEKVGRAVRPGMYVPPNEQHPAVALPIWRQSNRGAYVSVGTERASMGAAATEASALIVTDYDPEVVRFAQINRALLAANRGRRCRIF